MDFKDIMNKIGGTIGIHLSNRNLRLIANYIKNLTYAKYLMIFSLPRNAHTKTEYNHLISQPMEFICSCDDLILNVLIANAFRENKEQKGINDGT